MQDIKSIASDPQIFKDSVQKRNIKNINIDALIVAYKSLNALSQKVDNVRAEINQISKSMKTLNETERSDAIVRAQKLKDALKEAEARHREVRTQYDKQMLNVPNLLPADTPIGFDDSKNVEIRNIGTPPQFSFVSKDHLELGKNLDLLDFDAGTRSTGSKFYFLKNDAVLLEGALKRFALDILKQKGFYLLKTPDLAKQSILMGSGFNPRGDESNIYNIEGTDLSLIATAEITIGGFLSAKTFKGEALPFKLAAESHCFRREAGGAGQENKGLYRVHQFDKIEMYAVSTPEKSNDLLEELVAVEEEIYQKLKLPYRVLRICAGDLGAPAYKKYDLEAWMPCKAGRGEYGEITSASNCTDFQARRLNIKYMDASGKKGFAHTLNGTAVALPRVILAILENYQQEDGSVLIPEALRRYTGFERIEKPAKTSSLRNYILG